jgi:hypothetical protein
MNYHSIRKSTINSMISGNNNDLSISLSRLIFCYEGKYNLTRSCLESQRDRAIIMNNVQLFVGK